MDSVLNLNLNISHQQPYLDSAFLFENEDELLSSDQTNESESIQINVTDEQEFIELNRTTLNAQSSNESDQTGAPTDVLTPHEIYLKMVSNMANKYDLTKDAVQDILNLSLHLSKNKDQIDIPKTYYLYEKHFKCNLDKQFGFKSQCCEENVLITKSKTKDNKCPNCQSNINLKEMILSKNYFFTFNLKQMFILLLNRFPLKEETTSDSKLCSVYDSEFYKKVKAEKGNQPVVPITLSTDGVPIGKL